VVGDDDVGCAGEVRAQHHDHGRTLGERVVHFESDPKASFELHPVYSFEMAREAAKYNL
jgi:hypothetical protein